VRHQPRNNNNNNNILTDLIKLCIFNFALITGKLSRASMTLEPDGVRLRAVDLSSISGCIPPPEKCILRDVVYDLDH